MNKIICKVGEGNVSINTQLIKRVKVILYIDCRILDLVTVTHSKKEIGTFMESESMC